LIKLGKTSTVARVGVANPETGNDGIIGVNLIPYMRMLKSLEGKISARRMDAVNSENIATS
jgi:hypothetical protein